jgi:competence protein ComEC
MPFPLLFLAAAFAAGILAARVAAPAVPSAAGLAAAAAALAVGWTLFGARRTKAAFALFLFATAALGFRLTAAEDARFAANPLASLPTDAYIDFDGVLVRTPAKEIDRDILILRTTSATSAGRTTPARGRLRVSVPREPGGARLPRLLAGDRVRVSARLYPAREFKNFQRPFYGLYMRSRGIHARAFAKSALLVVKTADGPRASPRRLLSRLRLDFQAVLERAFPAPAGPGLTPRGSILEALLLGEDGRLDPEMERSLQGTGLYHLFAISGGHIAVLAFLLFGLLRLARVPKRASYAALAVLLTGYAVLVEGNASVLRAVIMAEAFLIGRLIWREAHILNAVGLSALILLLANPFHLFDAGFQLTYAATVSIILFAPRILKRLPRLPLGASELTAMSVAALLGVLPIMAADFNRVTFSSLLLNYAAVPLVALIMGLGYVFLPLAIVLPFTAAPFASALDDLVRVFERVAHLLDWAPILSYRIPTPHGWTVAGYAATLLLLLAPRKFRGQKPAAFVLFAGFFLVLVMYPFSPAVKELTVTFLDVGQGDSILVEFPGRVRMLVDAGGFPEGTFDVGESVVSPYLWRKGIKRLDALVLTHAHPDHIGGLPAVARNFRIGEFWDARTPARSEAYAALQSALRPGATRRRVGRGFAWERAGVRVDVLHPPAAAAEDPVEPVNDESIALRITRDGTSFLLAGDIGRAAEADILASGLPVRGNVLKAPHHGSGTSSSPEFLAAVSPAFVVVTVGDGNRYGLPSAAVIARYEAAGATVLRTDVQGAIEIASDGRRLRIKLAN